MHNCDLYDSSSWLSVEAKIEVQKVVTGIFHIFAAEAEEEKALQRQKPTKKEQEQDAEIENQPAPDQVFDIVAE